MADKTTTYLKTQIMTARPEQLTLMLFDGAIRFAQKGRQAILDKNFQHSFEALTRAEQITIELVNGLRPEVAPEICARQAALYLFIYQRLVLANLSRTVEPLDEALKILATLRETWLLLLDKLQAQPPDPDADRHPAPAPALSIHG